MPLFKKLGNCRERLYGIALLLPASLRSSDGLILSERPQRDARFVCRLRVDNIFRSNLRTNMGSEDQFLRFVRAFVTLGAYVSRPLSRQRFETIDCCRRPNIISHCPDKQDNNPPEFCTARMSLAPVSSDRHSDGIAVVADPERCPTGRATAETTDPSPHTPASQRTSSRSTRLAECIQPK